jgi:hypothetical protein
MEIKTIRKHRQPEAIALARLEVKLAWPTATTGSPERFVAIELRNKEKRTYRTAFSRKASDWRDAGPQKVPRISDDTLLALCR